MEASSSSYALKTAWRFVAVIYVWAALLALALITSRLWMPADEGAALFLATGFVCSVIILACFALAAVSWAAWSFRGRTRADRGGPLTALTVALITFALATS